MSSGFFVTLPSTASMDIYANNTQSDYTTKLAKTMHLDGQYKVGLAEVHLAASWQTLDASNDTFVVETDREVRVTEEYPGAPVTVQMPVGTYTREQVYTELTRIIPVEPPMLAIQYTDTRVSFYVAKGYKIEVPETCGWMGTVLGLTKEDLGQKKVSLPVKLFLDGKKDKTHTVKRASPQFFLIHPPPDLKEVIRHEPMQIEAKVAHGRYNTAEELFEQMKLSLPEIERARLSFRLMPSRKVKIYTIDPMRIMFPSANKGLGEMLGFDTFDRFMTSSVSKYALDLKRGIDGIYVYTDIISSQLVGDTCAPLLRVVNPSVRTRNDESIVMIYDRPDYYPLSRTVFDSIRIYMRTDEGVPLSFKYGKCLVKLHFVSRHEG